MKKSAWAVPGSSRAMTIEPATLCRPVLLVGSCAIGGKSLRVSLRTPPWIRPPLADAHRAVEGLAVEAVRVDVAEEVGGGDRRVGLVERDDDAAQAGVDRNRDQVRRPPPEARTDRRGRDAGRRRVRLRKR